MSHRTTPLTETLHAYLLNVSLRENPLLTQLREETARLPEANMQISPEQGQLMQMLIRMLGAKKVVEVGTFTGYSSLAMALALPSEGCIVACDVSEIWTATARRYWRQAGVCGRIDLRLGPAAETLNGMIQQGGSGQYDFAFIDADKTGYADYYEKCLQLLRIGGVIAFDNTLWHGKVADPAVHDEDTEALRRFNRALHSDDRIDLSMIPIGDGLTLARKR